MMVNIQLTLIDINEAFDTIGHIIQMQNIHFVGVRCIANSWHTTYLSKRMQYVEVYDYTSDLIQVKCGMPHGSVLDALLFIICINDICIASKVLECIPSAVNTNLCCSVYDIKDICEAVNVELSKLNSCFPVNKVSLNIQKTHNIEFGNTTIDGNISTHINNKIIDR